MHRQELDMRTTIMDSVILMSEGNPGAMTVLSRILENDQTLGFMDILSLDDMNIRGPQIWVGYKDYANQDIKAFVQAIRDRDPEMVKVINQECGREYVAVTSAASFKRDKSVF